MKFYWIQMKSQLSWPKEPRALNSLNLDFQLSPDLSSSCFFFLFTRNRFSVEGNKILRMTLRRQIKGQVMSFSLADPHDLGLSQDFLNE